MARKTTKLAKTMLEVHERQMQRITEQMKTHANDDYWAGFADAANVMVEMMLMEQNCYHGFTYVDEQMNPIADIDSNPEYREWRRRYGIKE